MGETKIFSCKEIEDASISTTIKDVANLLDERGYDSINQIVGYLMSGDPGYISSYKEARKKLTKIDRSKVIEVLVKELIK